MTMWSEGLWDTEDLETTAKRDLLVTARVATAGVWPFLAQSSDRQDFANRLELVRPRIVAEAVRLSPDPNFLTQVEAAYVTDFEHLLRARPPEPEEKTAATLPPLPPYTWSGGTQPFDPAPLVAHAKAAVQPKQAAVVKEACTNCGHDGLTAQGALDLCDRCGFIQEAKRRTYKGQPACPICHNGPDTEAHFEEAHAGEEDDGPKYNRPDKNNIYTHWGDTDEEGNAVGTGTGRSKKKKVANVQAQAARTPAPSPEDVEEARQIARQPRGDSLRVRAEYEGGLPCTHGDCDATFFTLGERVAHLAQTHGEQAKPAPRPRRRLLPRRQAANEKNLKKKCPVCGKEIPVSEMAHHMKAEHPHQAVSPDDQEKGEEAEAKEHETKERKEQHRPAEKRKKEGAAMDNPFSTSGGGNPFTPDDDSRANVPATMQPDGSNLPSAGTPFSTTNGPGTDAMSQMDDLNLPTNMRTSALKVASIVADLKYLNPGISDVDAHRLATATLQRYPGLEKEALGGADYVDGESLTDCPQCGKRAFSSASGHCHNCGYIQAA